ncbi:MAG: hypothetical protein KC616_08910 [Myxococcales bacterium]|nr:hypothetical protein [Myxococcales bacterium]
MTEPQDGGRRVASAAGLLAASVLAARLLGFARDALFAGQVGVGAAADAYFAAFMIPDILGYLLAAGAASVAVTPPYVRRLERDGPEAAARFAAVVVGNVGWLSIALTVVLWVAGEPLLRAQFGAFDEATLEETLRLMRIVLPAQIFFLTGGALRGVLMAHGVFWPQAAASVVYSAMPIVGGLLWPGTDGFAWGTLLGAAVGQWAIPVVALRRLPGAVGRMRAGPFDADFREYVWLALPLMLGLGLTTVDEWYEKWVGARVAPGAIAAITYARKLMMAPVGVVGQAVGAALLPSLTARHERGDVRGFDGLLTETLRTTLGLGLLAAAALGVLSLPLVRALYEHGEFGRANTLEVSRLLAVLACAVPGWVVQQVAVRGFYARGEMWRAMTLSTVVALAAFPVYLQAARSGGIDGLAIASTGAISVSAAITIGWLRLRSGAPDLGLLVATGLRTTVLATLAALVTGLVLGLSELVHGNAWLALFVGAGVYGVVALVGVRLFGDGPLRAGVERVLARLGRGAGRRS